MCATLAYARIPEPPALPPEERRSRRAGREILRDRRFILFVGGTFGVHFSTMLAGPFFNVYLVHNLGGSNFAVGMVSTASAFAGIVGQLWFGEIMSRRGALWLSRVATVAMPALPLMWIFVGGPWWVLLPNIAGGFLWAAFNLANFQLLLDITSEEQRDDYVAAFHICVFAALFVAPFAGGVIVDQWGYRVDFALSSMGRIFAAAMFLYAITTPKDGVRAGWRRRANAIGA
jgi:predicted MFS family arabinose efflux permease